mmetsp:Transcript_30637/g.99608  ORF Transcript_30637/g.99608 Transcript_30637/m.99608 type:complete len:435 (-) Transcript_30637:2259-3563(-)
MLREVALNQVARFIRGEAEDDVQLVDVAAVEANRMPRLHRSVPERDELVRALRRPRNLRGAREPEHEEVEHEAVVLDDEAGELEAGDEAVRVCVAHILVRNDNVVLRRHVIRDVVVDDEAQQTVEHRQVHLLLELFKLGLQHDHALALGGFPHIHEVVDALAPFVHKKRRGLGVRGLDPVGEEVTLVRLVVEVVVEVGVGDFLERLNLVHGGDVRVKVHKLDAHLLEGSLREEVPLDARQRLVRVVVRLLDEAELLALLLIESHRRGEPLAQPLEREHEQLGVVLVRQRRERDGRKLARLKPVHRGGVNRHRLLRSHVRPILEVVVLALLLRFEVEPREPPQVFPAHRLVHRRAAPDALAVVMRNVRPPVRLGLDVPQNHRLHGRWQSRHLPRDVCLPASPRLREVLQDGARFVGFDPLRHRVQQVVHDRRAQL